MKDQLTIKGLKTWSTHDGGGYQFNLYLDGKKIAFVHNDGNGGATEIGWSSKSAEAMVNEYVKTLPNWVSGDYSGEMTVDIFLEELLRDYEQETWLAKQRKKGTLYRLVSDSAETFRILATFDLVKAKEYLERKYPQGYVLL